MFRKILFAALLVSLPKFALADKEYDDCYLKAADDNQVALCMKAETARLLKNLQNVYEELSKHPQTSEWNNGNGLIKGNLKDMFDNWLGYRNRFCSLFVQASENTFGSQSFDKERCLLELTKNHYDLMDQVLINANSGSEEDDED